MSKSIGNLRVANRTTIMELEKKHTQTITEHERRFTTDSMETIMVNMKSKIFQKHPTYAVKRCDPLSLIAAKLQKHHPKLGKDDIDFGVKCLCARSGCISLVTDTSKTMEQVRDSACAQMSIKAQASADLV
ncbi:hypothetical protein LTR08_005168 [Meristemomyces frigidus]|nr:hypothetical protein LTR08_005168 [Meristemomyces frigidus]